MNPILDMLRAAAERHATNALPFAVRRHLSLAAEAPDAEAAARHLVEGILAAEEAEAAAKATATDLRERLALTLQELPARTMIRTAHHAASVTQGKASVIITDPALIPVEYMRQPPPAPDKAAIARAIAAGRQVAGAQMSNGGTPSLRIQSNRSDAA